MMKATPFTSKRLPKSGAAIMDLFSGEKVRFVRAEKGSLIRVRGIFGEYGRSVRYFAWRNS